MATKGTTVTMQAGTFQRGCTSPSNLTPHANNSDLEDFKWVQFPENFPDGTTVIVHLQTQTFHGPNTPGIRIANVSTSGFRWRFNELVAQTSEGITALSDGQHNSERLGYVAFGYENINKDDDTDGGDA